MAKVVYDERLTEAYMAEIDPEQANSIVLYGSRLQEDIAAMTEDILAELERTSSGLAEDEIERSAYMLEHFPSLYKADECLENLDKLRSLLEQEVTQILMEDVRRRNLAKINEENRRQLEHRIEALRRKGAVLKKQMGKSGMMEKHRLNSVILRLENKEKELRVSSEAASQQTGQLQVLSDGIRARSEILQVILYQLLPFWREVFHAMLSRKSEVFRESTDLDGECRRATDALRESLEQLLALQNKKKNSAAIPDPSRKDDTV